MVKIEYLANDIVAALIDWLSNELVYREFRFSVVNSRLAPGGVDEVVIGAEGALDNVIWRSG